MSVEEAKRTPGALLFYFSSEPPANLRRGRAHVAIGRGDGWTIEARDRSYDVGQFKAGHRFLWAAYIPGISEPASQKAYAAEVNGERSESDDEDDYAEDGPSLALQQFRGADGIDRDRDGDRLTDAFERLAGSDPTLRDTDRDGIDDGEEALRPRPGPLPSGTAGVIGSGRFAERVATARDDDGDGLSDRTERLLKTDARRADTDGDKLLDSDELSYGTDPLRFDTDGDGVSDCLEIRYGSDPLRVGAGLGRQFGRPLSSADDGGPSADSGPADPSTHGGTEPS
jgi:hypothetical protein